MSTPTVYDVAERAGVSIATVSRVFRKPESVRQANRDSVLAAARELGYVPSGSARGLASRATNVLGLCFPAYDDADMPADPAGDDADQAGLYAEQIILGMEQAARRRGYPLLIGASLSEGPEQLVATIATRVDGFAIMSRTVSADELEPVSRRLPIVMLAGPRELDTLDHIEVDNAGGQRDLTRHLVRDHGYTDIAFVGGPADSPDAEARFRGFREALAEAGLPAPDDPAERGALTRDSGREAVRRIAFRPGGLPRAVMFANDQMAVGALEELLEAGVRVPDDVALTGFDGVPIGRAVRPTLTTVRQPMRRLGQTAAELLTARLSGADRDPVSMTLPVATVLRESCGCGGS